jgi:hypothetical protein
MRFVACGIEVLPLLLRIIFCDRQHKKPGALWATKEEQYRSAEGRMLAA